MTTSDHKFTSLVNAVQGHAVTHFEDRAYVFLDERGEENASLTWAELNLRAALVASTLTARLRPGDRVLLVFPPRLDFIVAFFACQYVGMFAVPCVLPRQRGLRESSIRILENCSPALGLTSDGTLKLVRNAYARAPAAAGLDGSVLFPRNLPVPRPM